MVNNPLEKDSLVAVEFSVRQGQIDTLFGRLKVYDHSRVVIHDEVDDIIRWVNMHSWAVVNVRTMYEDEVERYENLKEEARHENVDGTT